MDGVTALGLVCNVIQLIEVAWNAVKACDQFYKHGTTVEIQEMRCTSQQLGQCTSSLHDSLGKVPQKALLLESDVELTELSKRCRDTAETLEKELKSLESAPRSGRRAAIVKTVKASWKMSRIEDVKRRLDEYTKVLDTKILVHLRYAVMLVQYKQQPDVKFTARI